MQYRKIIDDILFWCIIVVGEFIALHGKAIASFLFSKSSTLLRHIEAPIFVYIILFLSTTALSLIRLTEWNPKHKVVLSALIGLISAIATQLVALTYAKSTLIFFLQLFIYATACGVIWIENYLRLNLEKEFWRFMFENVFKAIRYILILYGAMIVILKYISSSNGETTISFITTISYPTFIIVISIFMISYWVLIPSWEKFVEGPIIRQ